MKVKTMSKKIWIIIVIVIILGIICGILLNKKSSNTTNTQNEIVKNKIENEEIINNEENSVNEQEENIEVTEPETTTTSTESFTENPETAEEKAIEIVKKDYGDESNTSFAVEGMDQNGRYIVTVRNSTTTEALAFYFVNISDGTFTKK
jgi:cytoskeletal protein RodZ